ncbi:MAG: cbb3-type cytochrome c oxidase N-terminal domain-containing protein [Bacteroidota bacterium]
MKKHITSIGLIAGTLLMNTAVNAQAVADSTTVATSGKYFTSVDPLFYQPSFYYLAIFILILLIAIFVMARTLLLIARGMAPAKEKVRTTTSKPIQTESFWARFDRKVLTQAVPIEKEADVMLDHDYDGIKELDNNLPPWWKWGFYFTIIWALVYVFHFHVLKTGLSQDQEYAASVQEAEEAQKLRASQMADMITPENVVRLTDATAIADGKDIFTKNCTACHGQNLEGGVGPNLTDPNWIHGGGIKNVFKTITNGVPLKGMISWKTQLSPKNIQAVASFILSMQNSNPANAKAPQGDVWVDESAPVTTNAVTSTTEAAVTETK